MRVADSLCGDGWDLFSMDVTFSIYFKVFFVRNLDSHLIMSTKHAVIYSERDRIG